MLHEHSKIESIAYIYDYCEYPKYKKTILVHELKQIRI